MIRTITLTLLPCTKIQVRSDSGIDHGHFDSYAAANKAVKVIMGRLAAQGLEARIEYAYETFDA